MQNFRLGGVITICRDMEILYFNNLYNTLNVPKNKLVIDESKYMPVRRDVEHTIISISPNMIYAWQPKAVSIDLKSTLVRSTKISTYISNLDISPFVLLNVYKTSILTDIFYKCNVQHKLYKVLLKICNCIVNEDDEKKAVSQKLRNLRNPLSIIEFHMLMDILKINVVLFDKYTSVIYKYGTAHDPCMLMQYINSKDVTYVDVFQNIGCINTVLLDFF